MQKDRDGKSEDAAGKAGGVYALALTKEELDNLSADVEDTAWHQGEGAIYEMTIKGCRALVAMARGYLDREAALKIAYKQVTETIETIDTLQQERERRESAEALLYHWQNRDHDRVDDAHADGCRKCAAYAEHRARYPEKP